MLIVAWLTNEPRHACSDIAFRTSRHQQAKRPALAWHGTHDRSRLWRDLQKRRVSSISTEDQGEAHPPPVLPDVRVDMYTTGWNA